MTNTILTRDEFSQWLDAYGADPQRWPNRAQAEALLAADPEARQLVSEAAALDRVLARVAHVTDRRPVRASLLDDIVRAAERSPRLAVANPSPPQVGSSALQQIPMPIGTAMQRAQHQAQQPNGAPLPRRASLLRTDARLSQRLLGGLMAASLLLGIGLGATPIGQYATPALATIVADDTARASETVLALAAADADEEPWTLGL